MCKTVPWTEPAISVGLRAGNEINTIFQLVKIPKHFACIPKLRKFLVWVCGINCRRHLLCSFLTAEYHTQFCKYFWFELLANIRLHQTKFYYTISYTESYTVEWTLRRVSVLVDPILTESRLNPLNAELNPICHLLALLGAHHILHVSRIRVNC
jgi:hypothetical protein